MTEKQARAPKQPEGLTLHHSLPNAIFVALLYTPPDNEWSHFPHLLYRFHRLFQESPIKPRE